MVIDGQVFMGMGDTSLAIVGYLYSRLGRALEILSGIQQPPRATDDFDPLWAEMVSDGHADVEEIAIELFFALTGKKPKK